MFVRQASGSAASPSNMDFHMLSLVLKMFRIEFQMPVNNIFDIENGLVNGHTTWLRATATYTHGNISKTFHRTSIQ